MCGWRRGGHPAPRVGHLGLWPWVQNLNQETAGGLLFHLSGQPSLGYPVFDPEPH